MSGTSLDGGVEVLGSFDGGRVVAQEAEDDGHEEKRSDGGDDKAADDGAAERRVLFAAFAEAGGHRQHADDHGERGHEDGPEPADAGFPRGAERVEALVEIVAGKGDDEDGVGGGDAEAHDGAHQRGDAEAGQREVQSPDDAGHGAGQRGDDDERVEPALEVDDEQQINQRDGH